MVDKCEAKKYVADRIGAEHIILATDSGQVNTPYWCDAVKESISYYRNAGITEEELKMMMIHNPSKVLNL